jgi:hypothetical protein
MRFVSFFIFLVLLFCAKVSVPVFAETLATDELSAKYLGARIDKFQAIGLSRPLTTEYDTVDGIESAPILSASARTYVGPAGRFDVMLSATESESASYALLTGFRDYFIRQGHAPLNQELGIASYVFKDQVLLAKGKLLLHIISVRPSRSEKSLPEFARLFAETLPRGEDEIPVLVKHLPKWGAEPRDVSYYVKLGALKSAVPSNVLDSLSFDGSEAVLTNYGPMRFLLIEFPTPQLATQNDQQILAKLQEMRAQGQQLPTAYRRVGNYGVFAFNGSDEASANALIDEVKYEQVTQWLGDNPYPLLEAQRRYTTQTLGVLVSVVKASGLALVICLTAGGLFGGLLFIRRRAQQKTIDAYSDAGGMLRLNLDEMTPQTDPARLLGK